MGAAGTMYSAYQQAQSEKLQAEYSASMGQVNARYADAQARDALRRGNQEAQKLQGQAKRVVGAQRVAAAGQGIEVNSGTAADLQAETEYLSEMDVMSVKNNAYREAWGFKAEAQQQRFGSQIARVEGKAKSRATLVTGGIKAGQQAYETAAKYGGGG